MTPVTDNKPETFSAKLLNQWKIDLVFFVSVLALVAYFTQACYMRKAMRIDQRAWVGFGGINSFVFERGKPFVVTVPLQNTGKTPAINVAAGLSADIISGQERPDLDKLIEQFMGTPTAVLLPNQVDKLHSEIYNSSTGAIPDDEFFKLSNRATQRSIIVFGKTTYSDAFGIGHWTRYCYRSEVDPLGGLLFRSCGFYSGTDSNIE